MNANTFPILAIAEFLGTIIFVTVFIWLINKRKKKIIDKNQITSLFGESSIVTSRLLDMAVGSGIHHYSKAVPNMTKDDAKKLTVLVQKYEHLDYKADAVNDYPEQRGLIKEINDLLTEIINRQT